GWIDGVAGKIDDERFTIRFAHRKPQSIWSAVNLKRIEELTAAGLMHPYGLKIFNQRDLTKQNLYAHEQERIELSAEYEAQFRANPQAWAFWEAQSPSYRKNAIWWVISAKQDATRLKRLSTLIEDSAAGRKIKSLTPKSKREG
ncbi:MAG: YdeI/OmpD-associated family protein, partial [Chloroflexota bacterium]